ncbi:MAG: LysM domain-containing protein [bacterium]|nr:LysM domain-containing protein [bacterium]
MSEPSSMLQKANSFGKRNRLFLTAAVVSLKLAACAAPPLAPPGLPNPPPPPGISVPAHDIDDTFCPPPPGWFTYIVRPGDTLHDLAEASNSSVSELAAANCLNNPRALAAGTRLYLPQRIG